MDLKYSLEAIANHFHWKVVYARRDYQNLTDVTDFIYSTSQSYETGETFMLIDPIIRHPHETGITYTGNLMILTNSDLDTESYEEKFENYIRPLLAIVLGRMKSNLLCNYDINLWRVIEIINFFDFNADGVSINFELKGY